MRQLTQMSFKCTGCGHCSVPSLHKHPFQRRVKGIVGRRPAGIIAVIGIALSFGARHVQADDGHPVDLNIVAHQDDDILFMNPDIMRAVSAGHRQVTVYLTGGNYFSDDHWYARARENGAMDGYAKMMQIVNGQRAGAFSSGRNPCDAFGSPLADDAGIVQWKTEQVHVGPYLVQSASMVGPSATDQASDWPSVQLYFIRIDASTTVDGDQVKYTMQGTPQGTKFANLYMLWTGTAPLVYTSDGRASYSKTQLIDLLKMIIRTINPAIVRTQDANDSQPTNGDYDHFDHYYGSLFARAALAEVKLPPSTAYWIYNGYNIDGVNANVAYNLTNFESCFKKTVMYYYALNDPNYFDQNGWNYRPVDPIGGGVQGMTFGNFGSSWLTHELATRLPLP